MKKSLLFLLFLAVVLTRCGTKENTVPTSQVIRIESNRDSLVADGETLLPVIVYINDSAVADKRNVSFDLVNAQLSDGSSGTTVTADDSGRAQIFIKSSGRGIAEITASIEGYLVRKTMVLKTAWPDLILVSVEPDSIGHAPGQSIAVKATLQRTSGMPTTGLQVLFKDVDSNGNSYGQIFNTTTSNENGEARGTYRLNSGSWTGTLSMHADVVRAPGDTIRGLDLFRIVP